MPEQPSELRQWLESLGLEGAEFHPGGQRVLHCSTLAAALAPPALAGRKSPHSALNGCVEGISSSL